MPASTLRLLGEFALETPGAAASPRLGRKARALLAFVACQPGAAANRGRLIALLWPDQSDEDARAALRQCLHLLRRQLGAAADGLDSDGDRIVLRTDAFDVDVHRFESLALRQDMESMLAAAQLYRGDFLDGLDAGVDFSGWAGAARQRLRDVAQALLTRLGEARGEGACDATVQLAHRLLASDPMHEGCYRALMRLHARAGLRGKALQTWEECRHALRRELDVEPSAQTRAVLEELRLGEDKSSAAVLAKTAPTARPASLVRSDEDCVILDLMLRGHQLFTLFTPESNAQARAVFEAAIARASDHADAIAFLGWTYWFDSLAGWSADPALSYQYASSCASRAVACNHGSSSTPHMLLGKVLLWRMEHDAALEQLRLGLAIEPESAYAQFNLGDALMFCGRCEEALAHLDQALKLDANEHGVFLTIQGQALWMMGRLREAQKTLGSAVRRNPTYAWAHGALATVHFERGDPEGARDAAAIARRLNGRFSVSFVGQVMPYRIAEHRQRMVKAWSAAGMPQCETPGGVPVSLPQYPARNIVAA